MKIQHRNVPKLFSELTLTCVLGTITVKQTAITIPPKTSIDTSGSLSFVSQTHRHKNAYTYSPTHTNRINILTGKSFHSANEMTTHRISTLSHALQSHAITQMSLLSIAHKSTLDFA